MADFETFKENYPKLREAGVSDEEIRQLAKEANFTDAQINDVINMHNNASQTKVIVEEAQPSTMTTEIPNETPEVSFVGDASQQPPQQMPMPGQSQPNVTQSIDEPGNPSDMTSLEPDKFLVKDDPLYQQMIDNLIKYKNQEDVFRQRSVDVLVNDLLAEGNSYEDALQQATEIEKETMKDFNISRYIQNNIYEPESTLDTASRVEKYNVLQRKFNLSDEEAKYWTEKWKEVAPSVLDSAAQAIENFSVGAKQDWYGALALGAQLFGFGDSEFAKNAKDKIKQLDAEATKINIERGSKLGAEDFSPVAILEAAATAAITASSLPASAVLASAAGLGALSGAVYAKGQGESDSSVVGSAVLGGALPLAIPAVAKVAKVMTDSLKTFLNVKGLYKRDIALYTQGLTAEEVIRASNFLSERGGGTTEIAWVAKNSQSWVNAGAFRAVGLFLSGRGTESRIVANNRDAIVQGVQDTINMMKTIDKEILKNSEGIDFDTFITENLIKNIKQAEKNLSHQIKEQYKNIDNVASNIFTPERKQVLEDIAKGVKELSEAYPGDRLHNYIELVGQKFNHFSGRTELQGGVTLKDLMDLQQSIKRDIQSKDADAQRILAITNLNINKVKQSMIDDATAVLQAKGGNEVTAADGEMLLKLKNFNQDIETANNTYKQKIDIFEADHIKKMLRVESTSPQATDYVADLIDSGDLTTLNMLKTIYTLSGNLKEFQLVGQRYVLNGLKNTINITDNTLFPKAESFIDKFLANTDLIKTFELPAQTQTHLLDLSRAIKAAKRMAVFSSSPHLSQNSFAGRIVYLASNFLDVVRNIVTSKVYHGDELERLIHAAKKFEIPTEQEIKTWNQQKIKRDAMKWNFMGMGLNLNSNQGQE